MPVSGDYMDWAATSDIGGHLIYLHQRAAALPHCKALELGVRGGCSTAAFLAGVEDSDGHLWSVDIANPDPPANGWRDNPRWTFHLGDDLILGDTDLLPAVVDLLFIDTSHRYQHTLDELTLYGPRVRTGGVILLHDTELEVAPASYSEEDRGFPVRRAVQEWCQRQFLTPEFRDGSNGLGVIEVT
jgi:predicted O-methyltransferase YrrM